MLRAGGWRAVLPGLQALSSQHVAACSRGLHDLALTPTPVQGGNGGRASISGAVATVFGCTGFVGHYVVHELAKIGSVVVCPFRSVEERAMPLKQMGDLGQIVLQREFSLADDDYVRDLISKSNVVVNLVGQAMETRNFSFEQVHTDWPARLAAIVADSPHVERFIHFSDIGARLDSNSRRMRSKAVGDAAVREAMPTATIFRPAPIVGEEDNFFNNLLGQLKSNVVVPLIDGGDQRVAPTLVTDVATAVLQSLRMSSSTGKTYYLAGPEELTIVGIKDLILATMREDEDASMYVPKALAKLLARPVDRLARMLPPLPARNYMSTSDWIEEISENKLLPSGSDVCSYADLDMVPHKVTEGLAIEAFRYQRVGGYQLGDTSKLVESLPTSVKRYFGMREERPL